MSMLLAMERALASNPYTKLIPQTLAMGRSGPLLGASDSRSLRNAFASGSLYGSFVRGAEEQPWWARSFAQYNFDFLKRNQPDGDSIYLEDSKWYAKIRGMGKGVRIMQNAWGLRLARKKFGKGAQATGDCVSWSKRFMNDTLRARRIVLTGKWEAFIERGATCGIYTGRGHNGQGADPVQLTAYLCEIGTLLEIEYTTASGTKYDFRNYDDYVSWGMRRGTSGMPADLLAMTKQARPLGYKVIQDVATVFDAIAAGAAVGCGSDWGVQSYGNPLSAQGPSWSHDMAACGIDTTREKIDKDVVAVDQSWGEGWNSLEDVPVEWQPLSEGQFFVSSDLYQKAVRQGGCTAIFDGEYFGASIDNAV
jgi:hypothetical protein